MDLPQILCYALVFVYGAAVGSFLNVIIYRFGSGVGISGRSKCLACGKPLRARMLIPLLSYLIQRGRCAYCGTRISAQYFLVELATALLLVSAAYANHLSLLTFSLQSSSLFVLDCLVLAVLVLVTVYDLRHKIIPDTLSVLFACIAGISLALKLHWGIFPERYIPIFDEIPWWIDIAAAPALFLPFGLLLLLSGGRAMGLGDGKLAWGIGWFLGFSGSISAAIFAFWIAFIPSIILLFTRGKQFTMKSEIPFAPFLVLGTLVVYIFGINVLDWTL